MFFSFLIGHHISDSKPITVFNESGPRLQIVLPKNSNTLEQEIAEDFARVLNSMSGHTYTIIQEHLYQDTAGIFIGNTQLVKNLDLLSNLIDKDSFFIRTDGDRLILAGLTPDATAFAVYWFLQKYGGVRWYLPTELGEHISKKTSWVLPLIDENVKPDFLSREFSGMSGEGSELWMRRNLLRGRFAFHHNIHRVIRPQDYEDHPEWFPVVNGKRYRPKGPEDTLWQPDLTNSEVAKEAVEFAEKHFEDNKNTISFSLGLNDNVRLGDTPITSGLVEPKRFFRGRPDYSDYVFNFMNEAALKLATSYPDKYLGCLAYFWCENTPTFPVEPKVLPYLTADRSQWYDPVFKKEDKALIQRWVNAGPEIIGIYDYYYGFRYTIPRIYFSLETESLKYAYNTGVRAFYAETNPIWGFDGPKLWLAAKLLWNINQSSEKLLDEYYHNYFQETARPMRRFFEKCEEQWLNQPVPARWIKYFKDVNQATLFSSKVCVKLRRILDGALSQAIHPIVQKRVELVSEAFRMTELLVEYQNAKNVLARKRIDTLEDIQTLQDVLINYWDIKKNLQDHNHRLKSSHPLNQYLSDFDYLFNSDPADRVIVNALEWAKYNQQWEEEGLPLLQFANKETKDDLFILQSYLENHSLAREILHNTDLEITRVSDIDEFVLWPNKWIINIRPAKSVRISLNHYAARTGEWGMEVRGSDATLIYQMVPVLPGRSYLFTSWHKGVISPASKLALTVRWRDRQGNYYDLQPRDRLPYGNIQDWTRLAILAEAPDNAINGYLLLEINNQEPNDYFWIDDLSILELPSHLQN